MHTQNPGLHDPGGGGAADCHVDAKKTSETRQFLEGVIKKKKRPKIAF